MSGKGMGSIFFERSRDKSNENESDHRSYLQFLQNLFTFRGILGF
jgi:hypothetical protein